MAPEKSIPPERHDENPGEESAPILRTADNEEAERLDAWLARTLPRFSRSFWGRWIREGRVRLDGETVKAAARVHPGTPVEIDPPPVSSPDGLIPEDRELDLLFEDDWILVINKPPGMVVHPAAGHDSATLAHALAARLERGEWEEGDLRPGIVHRLDRDTSGVLVAARTREALRRLKRQFKERSTRKQYIALVWGVPDPPEGTIDAPIGRNPHHRKKMMVDPPQGRPAVTHYEVMEDLGGFAVLRLGIETGRTHQIRVHLASLGHPVLGDSTYGGVRKRGMPPGIDRQMLHAEQLEISHPGNGKRLTFVAPMPEDLRSAIQTLRHARTE